MARRTFIFEAPDRFVTGTVGEPGARTFFLQARDGARVVSVSLDKTQVAVLAERLGRLLVELDRLGDTDDPAAGAAAGTATAPLPDTGPLDEPLNEAFRAASLTLGWDGALERVLIEAHAASDDDDEDFDEGEEESEEEALLEVLEADDDDPDAPDLFRVRLDAEAAHAFVRRAVDVIRAGRPACPVCGNPLDPGGHICPRKNGKYVN